MLIYKKILFAAVFMAILVPFSNAFAGYCVVTTDYDSRNDQGSLRAKFENTMNPNVQGCYLSSSMNDHKHFYQGVLFETPQLISGGPVETLVLGSRIQVKPAKSVVVGNPSPRMIVDPGVDLEDSRDFATDPYDDTFLVDAGIIPASLGLEFYGYTEDFVKKYFLADYRNNTLKEYGAVVINASQIDGAPFKCLSGAKPVFLRNLVVITNGYSKNKLFNGNSDRSCLRDAGAVRVCDASTHTYNPDEDPFANSGFLGAPWCRLKLSIKPKTPVPGNGNDDDCLDEDKITWYKDRDGDGYGRGKIRGMDVLAACDQPTGFVDNNSDCADNDAGTNSGVSEICGDGVDNNCDQTVDCEDGNCASDAICSGSSETETACDDGIDNDSDGMVDCSDADCQLDSACTGSDFETSCADGVDNDSDGLIDCQDTDCEDDLSCDLPLPPPSVGSVGVVMETTCDDGIDNDSDSAIDCADVDCEMDVACADVDVDQDGFSVSAGDCDDHNADVNPSATERCDDDIDNNCDDIIDELGCTPSVIDPPIPPVDGGSGLEGGGCGCNLKGKAPRLSHQLTLLILFILPAGALVWLRRKTAAKGGL